MLSIFAAIALAGATAPNAPAPANANAANFGVDRDIQIISDTEIIIDGHTYNSWDAVSDSGYYHQHDTRCGINPALFEAI